MTNLDYRVGKLEQQVAGGVGPSVVAPITGSTRDRVDELESEVARLKTVVVNVTDDTYGAVGDGVVDDTAAIHAAVAACQAAGGGTVYFPVGTFKLTSSLAVTGQHVRLCGAARGGSPVSDGGTTLVFPNASDCITVNGGVNDAYYCSIEDLTIKKAAASAGYAITLDAVSYVLIRNVVLSGAYSGVRIGTAAGVVSGNVVIEDVTGTCAAAGNGIDIQGATNGIWLSRVNLDGVAGSTGAGLKLPSGGSSGSLDTLYVTDCDFYLFGYGIYCVPSNSSTSVIQDVFISQTFFDGSQIYGCFIQASNASKVVTWVFNGCWFTSETEQAILVDSGTDCVDGIQFANCRIISAYKQGVLLQGTPINVEFDHCQLSKCSLAGSGSYDGMLFASTVTKFRVRNCKVGDYGQVGTILHAYGIHIQAGAADFVIENNDLNGNVSGGINDQTITGVRRYVRNNSGYNPFGALTAPGIPASTVAYTNPYSVDFDVYVTAGTSTCAVQVNGWAVATLPANAVGMFRVPACLTIKLTYANAPTWAWYGH